MRPFAPGQVIGGLVAKQDAILRRISSSPILKASLLTRLVPRRVELARTLTPVVSLMSLHPLLVEDDLVDEACIDRVSPSGLGQKRCFDWRRQSDGNVSSTGRCEGCWRQMRKTQDVLCLLLSV